MKKTLYILFIFLLGGSISAQKHVFKIRKVPQLKYFVFADGFNKHNLEEKKLENKSFPKRLYLQVYENDTFLIRWSDWKLAEANIKLDYLKRDSLTFAGKIIRQKKTGMCCTRQSMLFCFNWRIPYRFRHQFSARVSAVRRI